MEPWAVAVEVVRQQGREAGFEVDPDTAVPLDPEKVGARVAKSLIARQNRQA